MEETIIFAGGLTKRFEPLWAVRGLNLEVKRGEIFGLVGPDGAGKTTTMRLLSGLLKITSGKAQVLGLDLDTQAELVKQRIGYMPQRFALYPDLTVEENIDFHAGLHCLPKVEVKRRKGELLEFSRLTPFKDRLTKELSGGMKQKLGLCCALIHTPEVILLDEPTTGVDPLSRRDFWLILYQLSRQGVTILLTTPYMDEAERCNRIALMDSGQILVCGSPAEIQKLPDYEIYELSCTSPRRAKTVLGEIDWVETVVFFGERLHLGLPQGADPSRKLHEILAAQNIEIEKLQKIPPSLEDVFIFLSKGSSSN